MQRRTTHARGAGGVRNRHPLRQLPGDHPGEGPQALESSRAHLMDAATRELVWSRAHQRCEYCLIHQDDEPFYRLHVEHVIAKQHGGTDHPDNLALAWLATTTMSTSAQTSPASIPKPERWCAFSIRAV